MNARDTGKLGEMAAAAFLRKAGYEIVCANFRTRMGEIDLIARNRRYIVFAEVKTRAEHSMILPREAVGAAKQQKIIKTALHFLAENKVELQPRFDVIEVIIFPGDSFKVKEVRHLENAFSLS